MKCSSCLEKIIFSTHPDPNSSAADRALRSSPNLHRPHRACSPGPWIFIKKMNLDVINLLRATATYLRERHLRALTQGTNNNALCSLVFSGPTHKCQSVEPLSPTKHHFPTQPVIMPSLIKAMGAESLGLQQEVLSGEPPR